MDNIKQILENWDLGCVDFTPLKSQSQSVWDVNGKFILKRYQNADELSRGTQYAKLLAPYKIPVAVFIPTKDGQLTSPDGLFCLMTKISGVHIDLYKQPALAFVLGRELARLHKALADIEKDILYFRSFQMGNFIDSNLLDDWQNRIKPSLGDISQDIVQIVDKKLHEIFPKLPRQLIHRDVHVHNFLFDGEQFMGWLDFDIGQRNVRIFDIAYLLVGLLIGNIDNSEKIKIWHEIYNNLLSGYCEVNPLRDYEIAALPVLMIVIEFLFAYFWGNQGNAKQRNIALELAKWLYSRGKI